MSASMQHRPLYTLPVLTRPSIQNAIDRQRHETASTSRENLRMRVTNYGGIT